MVSNDVKTVGTALLLAAAPAGKGRAMDAASVLPALAAVPAGALTGTDMATVVELADPLDPQTVLTRLRAAAAAPGPLTLCLAGQLQLDRRQRLPHLALARSTPTTLRYTGLPWHWLAGELAPRHPGTTTVIADLAAEPELLQRLAADPNALQLGPSVALFAHVTPFPRRGAPSTPEYLRHFATLWRTGARPPLPILHAEAVAAASAADALLLAPAAPMGEPHRATAVAPPSGSPMAPPGVSPVAPPGETGVESPPTRRLGGTGARAVPERRAATTPAEASAVPGPTAAVAVAPGSVVPGSAAAVAGAQASVVPDSATPVPVAPASVVPGPATPVAVAPATAVPGPAASVALTPTTALAPASAVPGPEASPSVASAPAVPRPQRPAQPPVPPAPGIGGDPHPAILAAAMAGRHGEAAAMAATWESEALRRYGARSGEALHWVEVRADLARLAGEPARSCELWIAAAQARLGLRQGPDEPDVEGAVDRAHHQWEQIEDPARARALGPALVELRRHVPGRRAGALAALQRRMG
ncbi:hypothetical protein [Streptomyces sp. NPDC050600]|uniref:hypothetical protein n=1 Tax=Streptomyces sp. NPDC050600 TaxID=3157213 RepID=UPI003436311C